MRCATFGHSKRGVSEEETKRLTKLFVDLIQNGTTEFLNGFYGDFDIICAKIIRQLKREFPFIKLIGVTAYNEPKDATRNNEIKKTCDELEYPPLETVPKRFAITKRNEYMVDVADIIVFCVDVDFGGAYKTLEYAKTKNKEFINLGKLNQRP